MFALLAASIASIATIPTNAAISSNVHPYDVVALAPDCKSINPYRHCTAIKARNSFNYVAELHYKSVSGGFTGSCLVWFRPDNLPAPTTRQGYGLVQTDHYAHFFKATKLDYIIESCTHKGAFPEQVVATGVIALDRESLQ